MGALFLHLKPDEYLKKQYKTKKLVEKTSFSLQAKDKVRRLCPFDRDYIFSGADTPIS
ncbi:hypothetical protein NRS6120_20610 [Bacillus subtilis]|nr:hypothetical protein NRS6120_20610 [Bacillus subtilis]